MFPLKVTPESTSKNFSLSIRFSLNEGLAVVLNTDPRKFDFLSMLKIILKMGKDQQVLYPIQK